MNRRTAAKTPVSFLEEESVGSVDDVVVDCEVIKVFMGYDPAMLEPVVAGGMDSIAKEESVEELVRERRDVMLKREEGEVCIEA